LYPYKPPIKFISSSTQNSVVR